MGHPRAFGSVSKLGAEWEECHMGTLRLTTLGAILGVLVLAGVATNYVESQEPAPLLAPDPPLPGGDPAALGADGPDVLLIVEQELVTVAPGHRDVLAVPALQLAEQCCRSLVVIG